MISGVVETNKTFAPWCYVIWPRFEDSIIPICKVKNNGYIHVVKIRQFEKVFIKYLRENENVKDITKKPFQDIQR